MGLIETFIQWSQVLIQNYGYAGLFLVSLIGASTIIFPAFPLSFLVFFSASTLNPILVGISAGVGSATGELTGYYIGFGGGALLKKKQKELDKIEKLFQKYHPMIVIFFVSAFPLALMDFVGLFCGLVRYPVKNFYIALVLGKTVRYLAIALAGYYGISYILSFV